ncbi:MAG: CRP/FNR family cyclic AMP-dependent transcriptional regulator [Desulforhopalus sp.]|jgi:CRP/FNR family cyclic AMP-dependent transcriptional regulator
MAHQTLSESEEETRELLIDLPIFSSFSLDELSILAKHMSYVHLERAEYLFIEGDQGTFMGFVVKGVLEVQKITSAGDRVPLARLTKGSSIGEMAIIDQSVRSATVIAKQASTLVTLTEKGFELLADKQPSLGIKLLRKIARLLSLNMRRTSSKLADFLQSIH